jgi:hypothetical protein
MDCAFLNVFAIKMAGVFIMSTCTIVLRTGILPPLVDLFGIYVCGRAIPSHYELAMDRADISFVDVVNQHLHSDIGGSS